ncbi:hypothetical protein V6N13_100082 [Hibiscus sabdariffa]|uniref:Uncharacterized protein n=2 Tax=Hibiscus sabdariffa TaxID=183260 RepID=A0ABR2NUV0_9ROSI
MEMEQLRRSGGGLSILLVDQDTTALMYLASLLEQCSYSVTTTELTSVAISMIREGNERFKLVMADINRDEMSTLSLLRVAVKTNNIPVILLSTERSHEFAEKVIGYGACLYLQKPISVNDLRYLWQYAYRRPRIAAAKRDAYLRGIAFPAINNPKGKNKEIAPTPTGKGKDVQQMPAVAVGLGREGVKCGDGGSKGKAPYQHAGKDDEKTRNGNGAAANLKKPISARVGKTRLVWSKELHHKFAAAIEALGHDKARPMSILKMMNEPNLTHRQIASHLQKHKAQMQRNAAASPRNFSWNANASTSIFDRPGFLYMPQGGLGMGSTGPVSCFNWTQQWHQKPNFSLGFDPISSMKRTLQFPSMPQSAGNHVWVQPPRVADKSPTELDCRAATVLSEKWNKKESEKLVDLLKVLDEETDDCIGSSTEPHPAEVDRFCQLLKEAMLGNDQNP